MLRTMSDRRQFSVGLAAARSRWRISCADRSDASGARRSAGPPPPAADPAACRLGPRRRRVRTFTLRAATGTTEMIAGTARPLGVTTDRFSDRPCAPEPAKPSRWTFDNALPEATTVHWHGMHLPARCDGGPHQPVAPGGRWQPSWTVRQPAATLWYHPHPHGDDREAPLPRPRRSVHRRRRRRPRRTAPRLRRRRHSADHPGPTIHVHRRSRRIRLDGHRPPRRHDHHQWHCRAPTFRSGRSGWGCGSSTARGPAVQPRLRRRPGLPRRRQRRRPARRAGRDDAASSSAPGTGRDRGHRAPPMPDLTAVVPDRGMAPACSPAEAAKFGVDDTFHILELRPLPALRPTAALPASAGRPPRARCPTRNAPRDPSICSGS